MTPSVDFTTEAGSPPIEISKLDTVLDDIAAEITNSLAADGQTSPTANIKLNGFRLINLGAATALTDAPRVTELIDQDHIYYVDSGSANTYVITPSPAIAAYEEGQRFVFRAANANSGASTLNVNGLGAIAIQTVNAVALASGAIVAGGIYEVTYDANASPDRWVLTSLPSAIDGLLSSNVPLKNAANTFTGNITVSNASPQVTINETDSNNTAALELQNNGSARAFIGSCHVGSALIAGSENGDLAVRVEVGGVVVSCDGGTSIHMKVASTGVLAAAIANSTSETLVAGQLHFIDANATLPNLTAGQWIQVINDSASPITISKNGSDTTYYTLTGATVSTSFTLAARGVLTARCSSAGSVVYVSGSGITAVS